MNAPEPAPTIRRGEVCWAERPDAAGSAPGFRPPVVAVSSDAFHASRIQAAVVVVPTSNRRLADAPGNVRVRAREGGAPKESVANLSQVVTVAEETLTERAGRLRPATLEQPAIGLRLVLDP